MLSLAVRHAGNIAYVDGAATGNNDGTSWANAFTSLSSAIGLAHDCDLIDSVLVAQGTYYPNSIPPTTSTTTARDRSFYILRDSLVVLGGYPTGGGTRDHIANPTILSGDLDQSGTRNNNDAYHVVIVSGRAANNIDSLVIDGFTITGGNANGTGNIVLNSVIVDRNLGGGMVNYYGSSIISNCSFVNNVSTSLAGGCLVRHSPSTLILNCLFSGNQGNEGGGLNINILSNNSTVFGCLFTGNTGYFGGGLACYSAGTKVINSTFSGNFGTVGGGLRFGNYAQIKISNSVFGNNNTDISTTSTSYEINYCILQGLQSGVGNIIEDPLFMDTAGGYSTAPFVGGDYRLQFCSPAIGTGYNDSIPAGITTDLVGNTRIIGTNVDMGAYEKQSDRDNFGNNAKLSQSSANAVAFIATCEDGSGWTWYADPSNPDSLSFAIKWGTTNNAAKAAASVSLQVNDNHFVANNAVNAAVVTMKRFWNVDLGSNALVSPVSVRFFFDASDTTQMRTIADGLNVGSSHLLQWFKTTGAPYDTMLVTHNNINSGNFVRLTPVYGMANGVAYVEFDNLTSFSGGTAGIGAGSGSPLPLDLLRFTATAINNANTHLSWQTANERDMKEIVVARSISGKAWEDIAVLNPQGGSLNNYDAWDHSPHAGVNLYRLRMINNDATHTYSKIERVDFGNVDNMLFSVYPNPTSGSFTVQVLGLTTSAHLSIYDVLGRLRYTTVIKDGKNIITNAHLNGGMYHIKITYNNDQEFVQKLIVE